MKQSGEPDPSETYSNPNAPAPDSVVPRFGSARAASILRMEHVAVTKPDLARRAALEKTRARLLLASGGFALLFVALAGKLTFATVVNPLLPKHQEIVRHPSNPTPPPGVTLASAENSPALDVLPRAQRAMITDRNGEILAISLPIAAVYANPREMIDAAESAHKLKSVLPELNEEELRARLTGEKTFVYIARHVTPRQQLAVNRLGIPGVYFEPSEKRHYPLGRVAAQVLGGVNAEREGFAGVEKFFDKQLRASSVPLRLSLDVRVQAVVREELEKAKAEFHAIGACGIVMDVHSGEVLAMANLPDYDANDLATSDPNSLINRAVMGMYEPGSTFKLQTAAMALDSGAVQLWSQWNAADAIKVGRFTITDFEGKHRWLWLPEVLAYSSNLGAARIAATVGADRQRAWLKRMGMFSRVGIELPEAGLPIIPPPAAWKDLTTMTVGFGHGIAVSPLHVVRGTAAIANGGIVLRPTILAHNPSEAPQQGDRVMQQSTSDLLRKLMRLVVTDGYGKTAEVAGYFVGGKTGTAEKVGHGAYRKHANVAAFMSVFPMNAPRYAVYMMLDEPQANAQSHGYATAGWVAAPAAGRVIGRIGPMLGLLPQTDNAAAIQATLAIPMEPGGRTSVAKSETKTPPKSAGTHPASVQEAPSAPSAAPVLPRDLRHEALYVVPHVADR